MKKSMKKILLIGGGGSIGKALTNEFISKNYYVTIIDSISFKNKNKTKNVKYICDNFDSLDLNQLIKSHDVFFYLLSRLLPGDDNLDKFYLDISSYIRFIKIFSNHVGKKLILFSSGGSVYGEIKNRKVTEHDLLQPKSLYGHLKKVLESISEVNNSISSSKIYILRVSNAYGDFLKLKRNHGIISTIIHASHNERKVQIWGDGKNIKDYIHNDDIASACTKMIDYNGSAFQMNLSTGKGTSINEIIDLVNKTRKTPLEVEYVDKKSFDICYSILDNSLISKELNWKPKMSFFSGLNLLSKSFETN